jgi:hypothetical protein
MHTRTIIFGLLGSFALTSASPMAKPQISNLDNLGPLIPGGLGDLLGGLLGGNGNSNNGGNDAAASTTTAIETFVTLTPTAVEGMLGTGTATGAVATGTATAPTTTAGSMADEEPAAGTTLVPTSANFDNIATDTPGGIGRRI